MPLNSTAAAQARPTDPANADPGDGTAPGLDAAHLVPVLRATLARQWAKLERVPVADRAEAFDVLRWDRELAADLLPLYLAGGEDLDTAMLHSAALAERVNADTMRRLITGAPYPFSDREADYA